MLKQAFLLQQLISHMEMLITQVWYHRITVTHAMSESSFAAFKNYLLDISQYFKERWTFFAFHGMRKVSPLSDPTLKALSSAECPSMKLFYLAMYLKLNCVHCGKEWRVYQNHSSLWFAAPKGWVWIHIASELASKFPKSCK